VDKEERIIIFKYRVISLNKKIFNSVSKTDYNKKISEMENKKKKN
jgi:hypothetical protein